MRARASLFSTLSFGDFAALDAACADAQLAGSAIYFGLDGAKVDAPLATGDVVRVRDIVTELRTFAADFTDLCHDQTPKPELFVRT